MQWWIWVVLGAGLFIADVALINTYYLIWFGIGALLVGLLAAVVPESALWLQVAVFGVSSLSSLLLWLFVMQPKFRAREMEKAKEEAPGQSGVVVRFNDGRGTLRLQGPVGGRDVWEFRAETEVRPGDRLVVDEVGNDGVLRASPMQAVTG